MKRTYTSLLIALVALLLPCSMWAADPDLANDYTLVKSVTWGDGVNIAGSGACAYTAYDTGNKKQQSLTILTAPNDAAGWIAMQAWTDGSGKGWWNRADNSLYCVNAGRSAAVFGDDLTTGWLVVFECKSTASSAITLTNANGEPDGTFSYVASEDGQKYFCTITAAENAYVGFCGNKNAQGIKKISVYKPNNPVVATTYTVNYQDMNGNTLKDAVTYDAVGGNDVALTAADKQNITVGDDTYIYDNDDAEGKTVANDGSTVVTVKFHKAQNFSYKVFEVCGGKNARTTEGTNYETAKVTAPYRRYNVVDGQLYKKDATNKEYNYYFTLTADNQTEKLDYTAVDGVLNVIYLSEGEDIEGLTKCNTANTGIRSSNSASAYATEDTKIVKLSAGKYKIHAIIYDASKTPNSHWIFKAGETQVADFNCTTVNIQEFDSEEFTLTEDAEIILAKGGNNSMGLDALYITGDGHVVTDASEEKPYVPPVVEKYFIDNPKFQGMAALGNIRTYAKDKQAGEQSGLQELYGWKVVYENAGEDMTGRVSTNKEAWHAGGTAGGVVTSDNRNVPLVEVYASSGAGVKMQQEINVENGTYVVEVFATSHNARGEDGATLNGEANDVAYVFASSGDAMQKTYIKAVSNSGFVGNELTQAIAINPVKVTNGKLTIGLAIDKEKQTGWHTIQIYKLTKTDDNGDRRAGGIYALGSKYFLGSEGFVAPTTGAYGETEGNVLGMNAVWGAKAQYLSNEVTLEPGTYTFIAPVYNAGVENAPAESLIGFIGGGKNYFADKVAYPAGKWVTSGVTFTLTEATTGRFSLGYKATDQGSANQPHLFFGPLSLEDGEIELTNIPLFINTEATKDASLENPVQTNFVVNGTFDQNTNGWTATGGFQNNTLASNQSADFSVPFWENWNPSAKTNKMSQTVNNIPNGVYMLKIAAFVNTLADPNESQYVFANEDKEFLTSATPTFYKVYTKVENNQMEFGLEQTTATANWMGIDNVSLVYFGQNCTVAQAKLVDVDQVLADKELAQEVEAAQALLADEAYANVTGLERTNLQNAVNAVPVDAAALKAAVDAFKNAKAAYDGLVAAKAEYKLEAWPYASVEKKADMAAALEAAPASAADVDGIKAALIQPYRALIESNSLAEGVSNAQIFTDRIVNPKAENGLDGWTVSSGSFGVLSGEPWTDASGNSVHSYFDRWDGGAFDVTVSQKVTLPRGKYILSAFGRASAGLELTLIGGGETVAMTTIGNQGGIFNRGWNMAYVEFNNESDGEVEIGVHSSGQGNQWRSFGDFRIARIGDAENKAYDAAVDALKAEIQTAEELLQNEKFNVGRNALQNAIDEARTKLHSVSTSTIQEAIEALKAAEQAFIEANTLAGKYYLKNIKSGKFLGAANNWGTQASLVDHPEYVVLAGLPDGKYTIESQVSNGGDSYYFNGTFMDQKPPLSVEITGNGELDGTPLFNISAEGFDLFGYDGTNVLASGFTSDQPEAQWAVISEKEMAASLAKATAQKPVDATFLIYDHTFGRNNRNVGKWVVTPEKPSWGLDLTGGNSNKHTAEVYHHALTVSQEVEGAPAGVYKLDAQGFYRQDGSNNTDLPFVFANEEKSMIPLKTTSENSMAEACASFENGKFQLEPIYVKVEPNTTLTVGINNENNTELWTIWDNFVLTYYGPDADIETVKNSAIFDQLAELSKKAEELKAQVEVEAVKQALTDAVKNSASASNVETVNAAVETLKAAIDKAEASIKAKSVLPKMKQLIDATNVYTAEALDEYYGKWVVKYNDGSLTKTEANALQDPFLTTGWHAAITVDNFLLSAWDTEADLFQGYYINSWSVEGESDGSNFLVPFFEYWTGDGESLAQRTLTGTMTGLEPGEYEVKALVRVRMKNGAQAPTYGIEMQVNDGKGTNVAAGTQVGTSQMFLDEFTATGTVGEDGVLKIKFNVAADNNISWLAYKNVFFTKKETSPVIEIEDGVYDLTQDMFKRWESHQATEGEPINCAYELNTPSGLPYGDGNVFWLNYANLTGYDKLVVIVSEGTPRFCFNRIEDNAQDSGNADDAKFIDIPGKEWGTQAYQTADEGNKRFIIDLKKMTEERGFAHLHCIKGAYWQNVTVTEMKLIKGNVDMPSDINTVKVDLKNATVYNLRGQKVENVVKGGLYIVNGKKMVIK